MTQQPPEFGQPQQPAVPPPPPPGPAPQGYGQQPYPQSGYGQSPYVQGPRTDGFAIASLCCSLGFVVIQCFGIVTSILAIVFAYKAERRIRESNGMLTGAGLAKAGKIVGWVGIGLWIVYVIGSVIFFVVLFSASDTSSALGTIR